MKKYELLVTLPGTLDDNEVKEELKKVVDEVKNYCEGEVTINSLGKIRLAYPIKQIRYGYYHTLVFEAEPNKVPELNGKLRLNKDLLRAIISVYNPASKDIKLIFTTPQYAERKKPVLKEKITLEEVMVDKKDDVKDEKVAKSVSKPAVETSKKDSSQVDLTDIDKKLDAILDSSDIVPGI